MDENVKINGSVLLKITPLKHRNWYHSSLAVVGWGGNGLQIEQIGQFFQVLPVYLEKHAKN